ncbi:MAG TPA: cytochrome c peroxidase [Gemmatimonadaceae bacterium]|nr:cytochrome c peroxidase [Gemmatimonadaceae bacterium]HRQ77101.1 cytochrome c peroxidase [Gemmatimonadaceae bacterium]
MRVLDRLIIRAAAIVGIVSALGSAWPRPALSDAERQVIATLRLSALGPVPQDPTNRVADDPRAVAFGHRLFFDERLSSNGQVSCATCHVPAKGFQDGTPLAHGVGTTDRRTMPIAGTAHSPFQFWDGRRDSQWAQALGPLENPVEHGGTRAQYAHVVQRHHRDEYERIFGALPDLQRVPAAAGPVADPAARAAWARLAPSVQDDITRVYVNIGKAIAAYERRLSFAPSRFDAFAERIAAGAPVPTDILSDDEIAGARLFVGKAQCVNCHNGPLFTDQHFHNTGVPAARGLPTDRGRSVGAPQVLADEFNCRSKWSDGSATDCAELDYMVATGPELERAYKTPTLRGVAERAPYMHAGQFASLDAVIAHYDRAPRAPRGHSELRPLRLSAAERRQLTAFLHTLSSPIAAPAQLLERPR